MRQPPGCGQVERALAERLSRPEVGGEALDLDLAAHLVACNRCRADEKRMRDLMEMLKDQPVPDPGEAYWRRFPGRVQDTLAAPGPAAGRSISSRWMAWSGLAAAAVLALLLVNPPDSGPGPGRPAGTSSPDAGAALLTDLEASLAGAGSEGFDTLLDDLLGEPGLFEMTDEVGDLSTEERQILLDALQAELEGAA